MRGPVNEAYADPCFAFMASIFAMSSGGFSPRISFWKSSPLSSEPQLVR